MIFRAIARESRADCVCSRLNDITEILQELRNLS